MKFLDYLESMDVPCGSYVSPGVVVTGKFQICVHKKCEGEMINENEWQDKEIITTFGTYVAKLHNASRAYKKLHPEEFDKFDLQCKPSKDDH